MRALRRSIRRQDVFEWVDGFLRAAIARELRDFPQPAAGAGASAEMPF